MLQRMVDDFQRRAGIAVRLTTLVSAVAVSLFIAIGFLAAAAFIFVLQREGAVAACLAGGAVFLVVAVTAAGCYIAKKNQEKRRLELAAREAAQAAKDATHSAKSAASTILSDPATLAIGLQVVRMVGIRRLIPLLAIGGVAFGVFASQRNRSDAAPGE